MKFRILWILMWHFLEILDFKPKKGYNFKIRLIHISKKSREFLVFFSSCFPCEKFLIRDPRFLVSHEETICLSVANVSATNKPSFFRYRPDPHQLTKEGYYNDNLMWKYQKYTLNSSATTEWDSFMNEEGFLLFFLLCSTFKENTVT